MNTALKMTLLGGILGLAFGGLIGSATFGLWGGVVGSIIGIGTGASILGLAGKAAVDLERRHEEEEENEST